MAKGTSPSGLQHRGGYHSLRPRHTNIHQICRTAWKPRPTPSFWWIDLHRRHCLEDFPPVAGATATASRELPGHRRHCWREAARTFVSNEPGVADVCSHRRSGPGSPATRRPVARRSHRVTLPSGSPATDLGCGATNNGAVILVAPGFAISAGDAGDPHYCRVTNPPAGTIGDFSVATSSDPVPATPSPSPSGPTAAGEWCQREPRPTTGALSHLARSPPGSQRRHGRWREHRHPRRAVGDGLPKQRRLLHGGGGDSSTTIGLRHR